MRGWNPYVGAGYGIHFLSSEINAPTLGLIATKLAASLAP